MRMEGRPQEGGRTGRRGLQALGPRGAGMTASVLGDPVHDWWLLSNQTNQRLRFQGSDGSVLCLSALEKNKLVTTRDIEVFALRQFERQDYVMLHPHLSPRARRLASAVSLALGLLVLGMLGWGLLKVLRLSAETEVPVLAFFLLAVVLAFIWLIHQKRSAEQALVVLVRGGIQRLNFLLLLFIGLLIPATLLFASTPDIGGHLSQLRESPLRTGPGSHLLFFGCLLRLTLIVTLSLIPSLLFFAFDREHLTTLRDRLTRQLFRFDPFVKNKRDIEARYGGLMDEVYGPERDGSLVRYMPTRRSPLVAATLVLSAGWTLTLVGPVAAPEDTGAFILSLVTPRPSALAFGFLGGYFHTLYATFRSYARRDLQPKTYSHITVRILSVMTLAWVLEQVLSVPDTVLWGVMFVVGLVPETGLVLIQEFVRNSMARRKRAAPDLLDPHEPLTELDGIDLYDRARLQDEGVTNVEALAHHDLVELMFQTRIPAPRLLDWVDQAILHLHVNVRTPDGRPGRMLGVLRHHGIRTATNLVEAYEHARARGAEAAFLQHMSAAAGGDPDQLLTLMAVIGNEDWVENLRYWHTLPDPEEELLLDANTARSAPATAPHLAA